MRTQIQIPEELYRRTKKIAEMIHIPVSTFISLAIMDTTDALKASLLNIEKDKIKKKSKHTKIVNLTINDTYYNDIILGQMQKKEIKGYSFKDFAVDCIIYQCDAFDAINNCVNEEFIMDRKIYNTHSDKYSKELKKEHKPVALVEQYINYKSDQYGIPQKALLYFYTSKEINDIISKRPEEKDVFENSDYFSSIWI